MARIAKADVHAVLTNVGETLKKAGGPDKRISRADIDKAVDQIDDPNEKKLVGVFAKFCDHRDHVKGATLGHTDIDRSVEYAKKELISDYDVNENGLSKDEIGKMSMTGQLACLLAAQKKFAKEPKKTEITQQSAVQAANFEQSGE